MISIKQLVAASYTDGILDEEKVMRIANALSRPNLKRYIQALKNHERKHQVLIETAHEIDKKLLQDVEEMFSEKVVIMREDPSLLLGVRITDNDMVYEASMKHTLDELVTKMSE